MAQSVETWGERWKVAGGRRAQFSAAWVPNRPATSRAWDVVRGSRGRCQRLTVPTRGRRLGQVPRLEMWGGYLLVAEPSPRSSTPWLAESWDSSLLPSLLQEEAPPLSRRRM